MWLSRLWNIVPDNDHSAAIPYPKAKPPRTAMLLTALLLAAHSSNPATAQDDNSPHRPPWTTSRIQGSPEPPPAYTHETAFDKLSFDHALEMISIGERFVVVERAGKIWSFPDSETVEKSDPLIDLKALHPELTFAYGIAFHPQWKSNREVYITYTLASGLQDGSRLSRFRLTDHAIPELDPSSEEILLTWLSGGHNGANLRFGPDGMLYISTGDGTAPSPPDALNTGQDNSDLLSAILRINIDHSEEFDLYGVPEDNPFVHVKNVRPEIWAFGFRNPWKMSFDEKKRLWVGDVGWELWETIHLVGKGHNAGWSAMEGSQPIKPETASPLAPITPPVAAHPHSEAASITGGYVYRGSRLPKLRGAYIYGDYVTGKTWALWHDGQQVTRHEEIADTPHRIVTFGEGRDGSLYYIDYGKPAGIYRLIPNPKAGKSSDFPRLLSETGLFTDTASQTPAAGVYPYQVIEPMWQDGTEGQRFLALPNDSKIHTALARRADGTIRNAKVTWPVDAVLAKTVTTGQPSHHKIETQILHYDGQNWNPYSYHWNRDGSDAELIAAEGKEVSVPTQGWQGGNRYRIHSRSECSRCHNSWNQFVLGFQPWQLQALSHDNNLSVRENAIALGLVDDAFFERNTHGLLKSSHGDGSIDSRARSWLHVNCSTCHRRHGGGSTPLEVNFEVPLAQTQMLNQVPTRGDFGLDNARVIVPGEPSRSTLLYRINATGSAHMPLIGAAEVDENAERLLRKWIQTLPRERTRTDGASKTRSGDVSAAMETLAAISAGKLTDNERRDAVSAGLASPDANIRALFLRFLPPDQRPQTLGSTIEATTLLQLNGDPKRGAEILSPTGKWATCYSCHRIHGLGAMTGPDLSKVGSRLNKAQILESLVSPSKTIAPGFQAWRIETSDGKTETGFISEGTGSGITLRLGDGTIRTIAKADIKKQTPLATSLMPEGLLQTLTEQEAADVLSWLASLK